MCGGGGSEHDISLISARFLQEKLDAIPNTRCHWVEIKPDGTRVDARGLEVELRKDKTLTTNEGQYHLDFAIPCFHGPPGETGHIQSVFELMSLPYLGSGPEASTLCFNKISTKLWLTQLDIPNSPFCFINNLDSDEIDKASTFFKEYGDIFVKASSQGSSIGCYHVTDADELVPALRKALALSPYVLLEKTIIGRELEIATYEFENKVIATQPGEVICPKGFYTYEEKYSKQSHTKTLCPAPNLTPEIIEALQINSIKAFKGLKLKDLARIDFFLTTDGQFYINEINTFPGHTPISMFPTLLENHGHSYQQFLEEKINLTLSPS